MEEATTSYDATRRELNRIRGEDENGKIAGAYLTVKGFMRKYNCGRNTALRHLHACPGAIIIGGKLQAPAKDVEDYIKAKASKQRKEAPDLVPII